MPPSLGDRLAHILDSISDIQALLAETSLPALETDRVKRMALERWLEIICEAARHVPDDIKQGEPSIEWQRMVDLGNRLRHAYHSIQPDILCRIASDDLPPLKTFVERILAEEKRR